MPSKPASILEFIRNILHEDISVAQEALLAAIYGLPMPEASTASWIACQALDALYGLPTAKEDAGPLAVFLQRTKAPKRQSDVTAICGRRSGKTGRVGVNIGLYECLLGGHERYLGKNERLHVVIMAQTMRAVAETMVLAQAKIAESPRLQRELDGKPTANEVAFRNRTVLSIWPCSFTSIRGLHIPVGIMDEVGVWDVEGVNPDREVMNALRPAMAQFPNRLLVKLSTPWARMGILWDDFEKCWGKDAAKTLLFKAASWYMNPTLDAQFFIEEYDRDPDYARREFGGEFSAAKEAFLPYESIKAAIDEGVLERKPQPKRHYVATIDVAFRNDSTILIVGHREGDTVVQDVGREWKPTKGKPLDLEQMAKEIATILRAGAGKPGFNVRMVTGDQYAADPVREALRRHGIGFIEVAFKATQRRRELPHEASRREIGASKSDIYGTLKTLLLQERLVLLDIPEMIRQLRVLEVKRSFQGNEAVGAPAGHHDDFPSALALLCWQSWRADERRERPVRIEQVGALMLDARIIDEGDLSLPEELREERTVEIATVGGGVAWITGRQG